MFTGLVEKTGVLVQRTREGEAGHIRVEATPWTNAPTAGESVAVDGVCLTLTRVEGGTLEFDVLEETFRLTNLGDKSEGVRVNLERALRFGDRLGGHIVNGHIDGVGEVRRFESIGRDWALEVSCSPDLLAGIVYKGCVSCNGVSLTIVERDSDAFSVHLIPETYERTSLSDFSRGDPVNLEIDIVGKYVRSLLENGQVATRITWEALRSHGLVDEGNVTQDA